MGHCPLCLDCTTEELSTTLRDGSKMTKDPTFLLVHIDAELASIHCERGKPSVLPYARDLTICVSENDVLANLPDAEQHVSLVTEGLCSRETWC